ncbi:MAG: TRAP transporter substrate-binding protein [Pseudomonadota bacterium]
MEKLVILKTGLAAIVAAAAISTSAFAADVTLKLHQFLPPQSVVPSQILDVWADKVEADSGNTIMVERYPSMQLGGKPPELIDQAIDGVVDIVWTVVGYTPGRFPRTEVFELPFMLTNAEDTSCAFSKMFDKHMKDTEFQNLKVIGTWVHGPGVIHSNRPVRKVADMKGLKVRGASRTITSMLSELGATSVGMPVPAVPEALSKGVIDATTIPWEVTGALKVPELVTNHTEFGDQALYTLTFVLAMNKVKYDSLSDEMKAVIDANSGLSFSQFAGRVQQAADAPNRKAAEDAGNTIITLTDEQIAEWKTAAEPTVAGWIEDVKARGVDGQALFDEAKATITACASELRSTFAN